MDKELIIDIGMHKGEDTSYFLKKGFKVVSVDADPNMIVAAKINFADYIEKQKLELINYAVSDIDNQKVKFNISNNTLWNSLKNSIANRRTQFNNTIEVETITLSTIFKKYGTPYYCKIDIEGYDEIALKSLKGQAELPKFISAESECIGEFENISDIRALAVLIQLNELGYRQFKLVDQTTLKVLDPNKLFYQEIKEKIITRILTKLGLSKETHRKRLSAAFKHDFPFGASGPFGDDIEGQWSDFETAKTTLLKHRQDFFKLASVSNYGFWCDWHAKLS